MLAILTHKAAGPVLIGVASFAAGVAVTLLLEEYVEWEGPQEPEAVVEEPEGHPELPFEWSPGVVIDEKVVAAHPKVGEIIGKSPTWASIVPEEVEEVEEVVLERRNVFEDEAVEPDDDNWDYTQEVLQRTDNKPYVIHVDEFMSQESGLPHECLMYYTMDDIMCDDNNVPVYNYSQVVGELKFGHGSKDENVVYVRNVENSSEYEIYRHEGAYAQEILGIDIEQSAEASDLKHSAVRKFRDY